MSGGGGPVSPAESRAALTEHRDVAEKSVLRGGSADIARVVAASVAVAAAAALIALIVSWLY